MDALVVSLLLVPWGVHCWFFRCKQAIRLRLLCGNGDAACNGIPKLVNVAGVLMMSTLVSCVQRFSIHDLLLVVVILLSFFIADVGSG